MPIYSGFARIYNKHLWPDYSRGIAKILPVLLDKYSISPKTILDIACGEGSFAITMAKEGFRVTGVDLSRDMLLAAKEKAVKENAGVTFVEGDMRSLTFESGFDLVTCWFDSLNYMVTPQDIAKAFDSAARALEPGGHFTFDIRTTYGLMDFFGFTVESNEHPVSIMIDAPDVFVVSRPEWDYNTNIAKWLITGFLNEGNTWERIEETHYLHGYDLDEVHATLEKAGLTEIACFGNLLEMEPPRPDSRRLWVVARKVG